MLLLARVPLTVRQFDLWQKLKKKSRYVLVVLRLNNVMERKLYLFVFWIYVDDKGKHVSITCHYLLKVCLLVGSSYTQWSNGCMWILLKLNGRGMKMSDPLYILKVVNVGLLLVVCFATPLSFIIYAGMFNRHNMFKLL